MQPEPLANLPPTEHAPPLNSQVTAPLIPVVAPVGRHIIISPSNKFGLFRQYFSTSLPDHDPESNVQVADLSDTTVDRDDVALIPSSLFQPYPNLSAFLLGEWFWNKGFQKTQDNFQKLVDIITDYNFDPADVTGIAWNSLNKRLGDCGDSNDMWLDEPDADWKATQITLSIPFRNKICKPRGKKKLSSNLQQYTFPPFRHRSIISILKEKMANQHDFQHFHLEPYELRWHRHNTPAEESIRVLGELYTSPVFLETHEEIQALAGEPGCLLPRVLIGLMFGSDSTHLTSFGSASLWPCYMFFGNESKYRRCKPTCNLCNHIAYFQKVGSIFSA